MPPPIVLQGLGKKFRRYHPDRPTKLRHLFARGYRKLKPVATFRVLRDVSFSVAPGKMMGVIGRNGAGKSTLLRLIGGVGRPDEGRVATHGRIGAILDLGAGSHPDLTGRDNVFVTGVVAGLTRREVAQRFDAIVSFAELEEFIDSPLRTYSSGMQMRLAFSVAVHADPDILLIDEILSVGDIAFQRKCLDRIASFKTNGCAILLVSHDLPQIEKLCDEVIWLRDGCVAAQGAPTVVVAKYRNEMSEETRMRTPTQWPTLNTQYGTKLRVNENRLGSLEVEIVDIRLCNVAQQPVSELTSGDGLSVEISYLAHQPTAAPIVGVTISDEDGRICCETSTAMAGVTLPDCQGQDTIRLLIDRLDLCGGRYYVDVGVYEKDWVYAYDYHWHVYPLTVRPTALQKGVLCPPHRWEWENDDS